MTLNQNKMKLPEELEMIEKIKENAEKETKKYNKMQITKEEIIERERIKDEEVEDDTNQ